MYSSCDKSLSSAFARSSSGLTTKLPSAVTLAVTRLSLVSITDLKRAYGTLSTVFPTCTPNAASASELNDPSSVSDTTGVNVPLTGLSGVSTASSTFSDNASAASSSGSTSSSASSVSSSIASSSTDSASSSSAWRSLMSFNRFSSSVFSGLPSFPVFANWAGTTSVRTSANAPTPASMITSSTLPRCLPVTASDVAWPASSPVPPIAD